MVCCIYVAGLIETGRSGFGAGHVLPDYGHVQGLLVYHCLLCLCWGGGVGGSGAERSGVRLSGLFDVILCCVYVAGLIDTMVER